MPNQSDRQLEIDFLEECFKGKEQTLNPFLSEPVIERCHLCDEEKNEFAYIPVELDGMRHIASPYSDFMCNVCEDCYDKNDGDEVWRLHASRISIRDDIIKSRFVSIRAVITEKIQYYAM